MPPPTAGPDDGSVLTTSRRLAPVLLAVLLLVPLAGTVSAVDQEPVTDAILTQSGADLVVLMNRERTNLGLVPLRIDPALMAIARTRADVMAANDVMSHTEPDGHNVFDRINASGMTWFGGGEIIAWNDYPTEATSVVASMQAWMASPGHHDIIVSTAYNYVGFGAAVSATGKRYYAGVFVQEPDHTAPWAHFGTISKHSVIHHRVRVTIRWSGGDTLLQVRTAGLRYFEVQRRRVGGAWYSWGVTTSTQRTITWLRPYDHEVRVRSRDRAGNWSSWRVIRINL
jgi:uncharacterized protein YkwD